MKRVIFYTMAIAYIVAGINHFWHPGTYSKIIPQWVPWHDAVNILSGLFEILLGFLLFPAATRNVAAWGLIALLILIYPANIQMTIDYAEKSNPALWLAILRLPVQLLLIWWAYSYTNKYAFSKSRRTN